MITLLIQCLKYLDGEKPYFFKDTTETSFPYMIKFYLIFLLFSGKSGQRGFSVMYVDKGCCSQRGPSSSTERLFHKFTDQGIVIRMDPWHWMHRFDLAVLSEAHPKNTEFKSALSACIFAYNKSELDLLVEAYRKVSISTLNHAISIIILLVIVFAKLYLLSLHVI